MSKDDLSKAVFEAERFLKSAKVIKFYEGGSVMSSRRQSGEVKRRSMDLTRALADLRHPYRTK